MTTTRENIDKLRELNVRYPSQLKVVSGKEFVTRYPTAIYKSSEQELFDNADSRMIPYITRKLQTGLQVIVAGAGPDNVTVVVGRGLL